MYLVQICKIAILLIIGPDPDPDTNPLYQCAAITPSPPPSPLYVYSHPPPPPTTPPHPVCGTTLQHCSTTALLHLQVSDKKITDKKTKPYCEFHTSS